MTDKGLTGSAGEDFSADFLETKGYTITARNYHSRYGEIDIIAQFDVYIIFVEVKARSINSQITPAEAVTKAKQRKIILTAQEFLMRNNISMQPRFDVMEIYMNKGMPERCVHIENAFQCG